MSPSQRPLPDTIQHSQQTNIHASGGIRTHDRSRWAAIDLCLRPRSYWDRLTRRTNYPNLFCYKTLHVSGILSAHHQEFFTVHSALVSFTQVSDDRFQAESGWLCHITMHGNKNVKLWRTISTFLSQYTVSHHSKQYSWDLHTCIITSPINQNAITWTRRFLKLFVSAV